MPGAEAFSLRRIAVPAYGPTILGSTGQGAILPVLALAARDLGATVSVAALLVSVSVLAEFACAVPVGLFIDRVGERRALTLGGLLMVLAGVLGWFAPSLWVLVVATVLLGPASGVLIVARQSFLGQVVPAGQRARAMSTLGGVARIGYFTGPLLAAPFIAVHGARAAFLVLGIFGLADALLSWWTVDLPGTGLPDAAVSGARPPILTTVRSHSSVLLTLGLGVLVIGLARASRTVLVPLWAEHIGLSASQVSVLFGLASGVEMFLFYPAGWIMDRFGRVWVAVPVVAGFAVFLFALPLTSTIGGLATCLGGMAVGNGLGSGIVMTLGADAAPANGRAAFLGVWRLSSLIGSNGASVLVAAIAGVAGLAPAAIVLGVLCALGAGWLARWVPRYDPRRRADGIRDPAESVAPGPAPPGESLPGGAG